ncbi:hypothetical protein [Gordonia alkaliphila]|uniref:Gp28/Gp37-like domain-containing protein n=1 Tax=Gordonia alkaliphila TaxID=1053547 RepID=A0ABP8ZK18_9ACTN
MTLAAQIEQIITDVDDQFADVTEQLSLGPVVYLYDGNQRLQHVVFDPIEATAEDVENAAGAVTVTIPASHPAAEWLMDEAGRRRRGEGVNVHLEYRVGGTRVSGRVSPELGITAERLDTGEDVVRAAAVGEYKNLEMVRVWSNPWLPAIFQFPRIFLLAGPAIWVLKVSLFVNLLRLFGSLWQLPDDPMNPMSWLSGLDMSTWDIVIKPTTLLTDMAAGTVWAVAASRFRSWAEMAAPILDDAELTVTTGRWRAGDPEPWPGAVVKDGALIVDIVDHSRHREGAVRGGTIFDGMTRTIRESVGDLIEDVETAFAGAPSSDVADAWRSVMTTAPGWPTVHIAADEDSRPTVVRRPPGAVHLTMGGQSAPGVNEGISATVQSVGDLVTSNINVSGYGIGPQGGAIDTLLKPLYTDTVAAWLSAKLIARRNQVGSSHFLEDFISLPGKCYTISTLMALRAGERATRGDEAVTAQFPTDSPWILGQPGHGHAWTGSPVSFEVPGSLSRDIHVERIKKTAAVFTENAADDGLFRAAEIGRKDPTDPFETVLSRIKGLADIATDAGVW